MRCIEEATRYISIDQLALSPQCEFVSEIGGNLLSEEKQWRKLGEAIKRTLPVPGMPCLLPSPLRVSRAVGLTFTGGDVVRCRRWYYTSGREMLHLITAELRPMTGGTRMLSCRGLLMCTHLENDHFPR